MTAEEKKEELGFDPLDMNNYKVEKLPIREKSGFEKWMAKLGGPLALITFILLGFVVDIPFLQNISPDHLSSSALKEYNNPEKVFKIVKSSDVPEEYREGFKSVKDKLKKQSKTASVKKIKPEQIVASFSKDELSAWEKIKSKAFGRANALMLAVFWLQLFYG